MVSGIDGADGGGRINRNGAGEIDLAIDPVLFECHAFVANPSPRIGGGGEEATEVAG